MIKIDNHFSLLHCIIYGLPSAVIVHAVPSVPIYVILTGYSVNSIARNVLTTAKCGEQMGKVKANTLFGFLVSMDLFHKNLFSAFRGFGSSRRRDVSVLEGTICKQFVMSVKKRKNLKPCRGFKSFRSLALRIQFMKKCVFGSSNPSTRRKIENGSMEI